MVLNRKIVPRNSSIIARAVKRGIGIGVRGR